MAAKKPQPKERMRLIDPVYKKFTARAFKTMTSAEFYDYFMATMSRGQHEFQFSNRKIDKQVDERWVDAIEEALPAMEAISRDPRIIITQEELITNVVLVKKVTSEVVKHLCSHANLVETITEDGDVIPSKLLNLYKEESWDTYENRFAYSLIERAYQFVDLRYRKLFETMEDEFGAHLKIDSHSNNALEAIDVSIDMRINQVEDLLSTDGKHENVFSRIARIHRVLQSLQSGKFGQEMSKYARVRPPLVPTNAIKKNPYLRKCNKLWDFLLAYLDIGYSIEIIEQNPEINTKFEQDIFNDLMFNYIILKGYLEDNRDRAVDYKMRAKKKQLKPKYIKEIIEEIVQDYDLPDIEIRKVLIEELTKAQLMQEEENERLRLVAEKEAEMKEQKRLEDLEKARLQKEKEKEERRIAREKERERIRKIKEAEAEKARIEKEKERKLAFEARLGDTFAKELGEQQANIKAVLQAREKQRQLEEDARLKAEKARLAEEARIKKAKEAEERRLKKEAEEAEKRKREEAEQIRREAEAKAKLSEERMRLAQEKKAQQEAKALARKLERERAKAQLAAQKAADEAERLELERRDLEEKARLEAERIEAEQQAKIQAEEKARLEKQRIEEEIRLEKQRIAEEAKAEKARLIQEVERIIEERTATEFAKSGQGRGKNARIKKKLEQKMRAEIKEEEYVKAGLKKAKVVEKPEAPVEKEIKPLVEEIPAEEVNVVEEVAENVAAETVAEETVTEETAEKNSIRDTLGRQWRRWRK